MYSIRLKGKLAFGNLEGMDWGVQFRLNPTLFIYKLIKPFFERTVLH